jgi:hypothetical protein
VTTIINLYGGPGCGKSTSAAYIYYLLKCAGLNAELVREYVKEWAWENRSIGKFDQLYFLGKQSRKESLLYGKADYVVTDSPVLLSVYYAQRYAPENFAAGLKSAAYSFYWLAKEQGHRHIHVNLNRTKPYNPAGRYQNEQEATEIDGFLTELLAEAQAHPMFPMGLFETTGTDRADLQKLVKKIVDTAAPA